MSAIEHSKMVCSLDGSIKSMDISQTQATIPYKLLRTHLIQIRLAVGATRNGLDCLTFSGSVQSQKNHTETSPHLF